MNPAREFVALPDRCPGQISWHYDRSEIIADGVVHAIGACLGLIGAVAIVVMAVKIKRINVAPILVYVIGLVTMLAFSAAYNMWPVSPVKWVLRRFDHSAIYLLIAATYTPFLGQMKNTLASAGLGIGVWLSAAAGVTHSMPAARLERYRCLRLPRICHPQPEPMASCGRGYSLLVRHALSSLGALALSQRDLAWFCLARGKLPLFGCPRLLACA
jgi:Haemolysin-III related